MGGCYARCDVRSVHGTVLESNAQLSMAAKGLSMFGEAGRRAFCF